LRFSRTLAAVFIALAFIGQANAAEKVRIIHSTGGFSYIPVFVAEAMGYFEEAGLDVEMLRTESGSKALAAVIGGDADIFMGSTNSPIVAQSKGAPIVLFAAMLNQYSSDIFVSKAWAEQHDITSESSYEDRLAALKGLTIGVTGAGSGTEQIVRYLAQEAGLDPDRDMTIVALGSSEASMLAAFDQGKVDALSRSAPTYYVAEREYGATMLFHVSTGAVKVLDGYFQVGAAARSDWLASHEAEAIKVVQAIQKALNTIRDPETGPKARDAVRKAYYESLDPDLFKRAWDDLDESVPETAAVNIKMVEQVIEFSNHFAREQLPMDLAKDAVIEKYADEALKQME
jgi:NitT/TauT family transport system substrate-binding protein